MDWTLLFQQGGTLVAMMVIVMLSILLNSTGLELATSRNVDLDQELKANGIANIVNGACGGMVGYLSINRCLLNQQAGARSPVAGMIAGGLCGCVLLLGSSFLAYVPKPLLGGLLLYIGTSLLVRWVVQSWSQFSRTDYLLIVSILVVIGMFGFLWGVGAGIVISCLLFIVSYGRTSSIKHTLSGGSYQSNVSRSASQQQCLEREGDAIAIVVLHGFVFFGTANDLLDGIRGRLAAAERRKLDFVVFDFRLVTGLDSSAGLSFMKLRQLAENSLLNLVFTHLSEGIETQLMQGGLFSGNSTRLHRFTDLDRGVEWCENQMLQAAGVLSSPAVPLVSQLRDFLNDRDLASGMLPFFQAMDLSEGQPVFRQGERSEGLYFLESGRASVVVELPNGRTLRRRTFTGGAILGEMGFYTRDPRSASVIADQPCRLHYLSAQAFRRLESDFPPIASCFHRAVVGLVANRLRRSEDEVKELLQ